jgi:hypothetical protein
MQEGGATGPPGEAGSVVHPGGWYDDPEISGVKRYWDGAAWTNSRVTTEGLAYQVPAQVPTSRSGPSPTGLLLAAVLLVGGAVCLWIAQNYKPTVGNELGLNGNSHVLTPGAYHTLMIVGIACLILGGIRLVVALIR